MNRNGSTPDLPTQTWVRLGLLIIAVIALVIAVGGNNHHALNIAEGCFVLVGLITVVMDVRRRGPGGPRR